MCKSYDWFTQYAVMLVGFPQDAEPQLLNGTVLEDGCWEGSGRIEIGFLEQDFIGIQHL